MVPGEITSSLSNGTNALLRIGATPVTCVEDVLEVFGLEPADAVARTVGPAAERLLARLGDGPLTAVELELAGRVTLEDGVDRAAI